MKFGYEAYTYIYLTHSLLYPPFGGVLFYIGDAFMISTSIHRVNFYDIDAMACVHHSNFISWFDICRVNFLSEIGISLFLACVGLGAGKGFIETIINEGGYVWIAYGAIITLLPLLIVGIIGRYVYKLNYYTLIGVLSGATTNPPALAYSNDLTSCDAPAVGYATVYPLTMFLRVLTAQILILALA